MTSKCILGLLIVFIQFFWSLGVRADEIFESVKRVQNPSEPVNGSREIELKEMWRLDEESNDPLIGLITDVCLDSSGNICLLDYQMKTILVYNQEGDLLRTIGREGDGPGEFRRAYNIHTWPGSYIGVTTPEPPRIQLFHKNGNPQRDVFIAESNADSSLGNPSLRKSMIADGWIGAEIRYRKYDTDQIRGKRQICTINPDGSIRNLYFTIDYTVELRKTQTRYEDELNWPKSRWSLFDDGKICYATGHTDYTIHICGSDGNEFQVIGRDYESVKRSSLEKRRAERQFEKEQRFYPNISWVTSDYHSDIEDLYARPDGTLWVQTSMGRWRTPEGACSAYDVFDVNGQFIEHVYLKAPGDLDNDKIYLLGKTVVIVYDFWDRAYRMGGTMTPESDKAKDKTTDALVICFSL